MKEVSRAKLYELVWSTPMKTLAPSFNVSDVALRKVCVKAHVPVPERGYWAKLAAGKPVRRIQLPVRPPGLDDVIRVGASSYYRSYLSDEELLGPIPPLPEFPEPEQEVRERIKRLLGKVRLIKSLDTPHITIARLLQADDERRAKQAKASYISSWDAPIFDAPFERRRLRILNTLAMAIAKAGAKLTIQGQAAQDIGFRVHDNFVGLRLDTPANVKIDSRESRYSRRSPETAKAVLRLVILDPGSTTKERFAWEDGKARTVEDDIEEIAVSLIWAAELTYREGRIHHHAWRVRRRAEVIEQRRLAQERAEREERERQARLAQERIDDLLDQADSLQRADVIRRYVARVKELASGLDDAPPDGLEEWTAWALKIADTIDPVANGRYWRSQHSTGLISGG